MDVAGGMLGGAAAAVTGSWFLAGWAAGSGVLVAHGGGGLGWDGRVGWVECQMVESENVMDFRTSDVSLCLLILDSNRVDWRVV